MLSAAGLDPGQRDATRLGKSDEELALIIPILTNLKVFLEESSYSEFRIRGSPWGC